MTIVNKRILLFIVPAFFFIVQCKNNASGPVARVDSTANTEDTSRLSGSSPADAITTAQVNNALVFHVDDSMKTGKGYKATLALGQDLSLDDLKDAVRKAINSNTNKFYSDTALKMAPRMKATLQELDPVANKNFEITPLSENAAVQSITEGKGNETYWQWNVVPLKQGHHELELIVEIVQDEKHNLFLPSRSIPVMILATPESFTSKFSTFFDKNWQWMITAILIPIFVAWFSTRIKLSQSPSAKKAAPKKRRRK